jgi:hypothetical protein
MTAAVLSDDILRAIFSMSKVTFILLNFSDSMIRDEAADYIFAPVAPPKSRGHQPVEV